MFTTRIAKVAEHLGYDVEWIETAEEFGAAGPGELRERPGEALHGREGRLFERVTRRRPALLLFDLNNAAIPWRVWIAALKSSAATRRIPILCFGPHEDVATMTAARDAGADAVLARSRFTADMPALFQRYARVPDTAALAAACAEPLPEPIHAAIALFNAGHYYECHDALEEAWRGDERPGRELYQGLLQVGIAYYQIERGNSRGALKMLLRARQWLEPLPDVCRGVDVAGLRADANRVYEALISLGTTPLEEFDRALFRPVRLV
jgi:CheY-like chemotaxis protein